MRIWLVNPFESLPSTGFRAGRYHALARALSARGHEVRWWSSDFLHFTKTYASPRLELERCELSAIHTPSYESNVSLARIWSHGVLAARTFAAQQREQSTPDLIVATLPPVELCASVVAYAALHRVPICVDVYDTWPDSFALALPAPLRPMAPVLLWPHRRLLRFALGRSDALIATSETFLDWAIARRGRGIDRRGVFPWAAPPTVAPERREPHVPMRIIFCGSFGITYDFDLMIEAARLLERRRPGELVLEIVGDGPRRMEIARKVAGVPNVRLRPSVGAELLDLALSESDVGLCCYVANAPQSVPMKLCDYVNHGLPVISTLRGEMEALLAAQGIGLTISTAAGLAEALLDLHEQPARWHEMAAASLRYSHSLDLDRESERLCEFLEGICRGC